MFALSNLLGAFFVYPTRTLRHRKRRKTMRFEVELNLTYKKLLALYTASERCFRRKEMLLFRIIFGLLGTLVGLYALIGVVLAILVFVKVLK